MPKFADPNVRAIETMAARMVRGMEDHSTARSLQGVVNRLHSGAAALDSVNRNRSPLETESAHAIKVANMARKLDKEVTVSMNRLGEVLRGGMNDAQRRIDEKINLKPDAFASEIRAAFRSLSAKAKGELINQLVEENRGPELAAIVKAPSVLTGISDGQRAQYEEMIISKHAPAELDEQRALQGIFEEGFAATSTAASFAQSLIDPSRLARIEREAAASSAAGEAFHQSMQ